MRALDGLHERVEVGGHLGVGDRRALQEVGQVVLAVDRGAQAADGDGPAVALVDGDQPEHSDDRAARAHRRQLLHLIPDDGLDGAGDIAELQLEEALSVALLAL